MVLGALGSYFFVVLNGFEVILRINEAGDKVETAMAVACKRCSFCLFLHGLSLLVWKKEGGCLESQ